MSLISIIDLIIFIDVDFINLFFLPYWYYGLDLNSW